MVGRRCFAFLELYIGKRHLCIGRDGFVRADSVFLLLRRVEVLPDVLPTAKNLGLDLSGKFLAAACQDNVVFREAMIRRGCTKEPYGNQLQDSVLSGRKLRRICSAHGPSRDNGVVITDLAAVAERIYRDIRLVARLLSLLMGGLSSRLNSVLHSRLDSLPDSEFLRHLRDQARQHGLHVLRQISAIGTWIGHQFLLIERLGVIQSLLCGEAENTVGVPLQARQIVEKRRTFCFFLSVHGFDHGFRRLTAFGEELQGILLRIESPAGCGQSIQIELYGVERLRLEGCNLGIAHHDHCQRWCHDAADVQCLTIQA